MFDNCKKKKACSKQHESTVVKSEVICLLLRLG